MPNDLLGSLESLPLVSNLLGGDKDRTKYEKEDEESGGDSADTGKDDENSNDSVRLPPAAMAGSVVRHLVISCILFVIGIGVTSSVRPALIVTAIDNPTHASYFNAFLLFIQAFFSVVLAPLLGSVSDHAGRKPIYFLIFMCELLGLLLIARFPYSMTWQIPAYALLSMLTCYLTMARAIVADISVGSQHATSNFGYLGGTASVCFLVGPAIGTLIERVYDHASLHAGCLLMLLGSVYVFFVLEETLYSLPTDTPRHPWKDTVNALRHADPNPLPRAYEFISKSKSMRWLALTYAASSVAATGVQATIYLYVNQRLGWGPSEFTVFLCIFGFSVFVIEAGAARLVVRYLGERVATAGALASSTAGLCIFACATNDITFYVGLFVGVFGLIVDPAFKGILARQTTPDHQGALQGTFSALSDIMRPLSPLLANLMFSIGDRYNLSGLPLFGLALFSAAAIVFVWIALSTSDLVQGF